MFKADFSGYLIRESVKVLPVPSIFELFDGNDISVKLSRARLISPG
jgi:hypothetical protein